MTDEAYDDSCAFCAIARGSAEASIVDQDEHTIAFMDIRPVRPGHTLVIPRRHAPLLGDLADGQLAWLWASAMRVYRALRSSEVPMDAVNVVVADGPSAGQEVPHAHVHLVPRSQGDGFGFRFPPGYGAMLPRAELEAMAARIHAALPGRPAPLRVE